MIVKKIKPMYTAVLTTAKFYPKDYREPGSPIISKRAGTLREYQEVLEVGSNVSEDVKVGSMVYINLTNYAKYKYKGTGSVLEQDAHAQDTIVEWALPYITVDGIKRLLFDMRDIVFVATEYDDSDETKPHNIIAPQVNIIKPV